MLAQAAQVIPLMPTVFLSDNYNPLKLVTLKPEFSIADLISMAVLSMSFISTNFWAKSTETEQVELWAFKAFSTFEAQPPQVIPSTLNR